MREQQLAVLWHRELGAFDGQAADDLSFRSDLGAGRFSLNTWRGCENHVQKPGRIFRAFFLATIASFKFNDGGDARLEHEQLQSLQNGECKAA